MSLPSSVFLAISGSLLFFFLQMASPLRGDNLSLKTPPISGKQTGSTCWTDEPQHHVAELGWNTDPRADVKISFNKRAEVCLVEVELRIIRNEEIVYKSRSVSDTTGREYADYIWGKPETGNSADSPAMLCEIFLSSGEQFECHSESEFDEVVANLMN